jgi:hypothetical protein
MTNTLRFAQSVKEFLFCCDQRARAAVGSLVYISLGMKYNKREVIIIIIRAELFRTLNLK